MSQKRKEDNYQSKQKLRKKLLEVIDPKEFLVKRSLPKIKKVCQFNPIQFNFNSIPQRQ